MPSRTTYTNLGNGTPFDLSKARVRNLRLAKEVAESEWRSRVWTIQEAQLAQICIVKTQHQILDGEFLDHLLHQPEHVDGVQFAALGHVYPAGSPVVNVRGVWNAFELKAYSCTFGNRQWWSARHQSSVPSMPHKTGLLEALKLAEGRTCSMPLDYVIGLLGLVHGTIPPLNAHADTWKSLWTKLVQSGVACIDMLRSQGASEEDTTCWAPASISRTRPFETVGMAGETKPQDLRLVDGGLELTGYPLDVTVGDKVEIEDNDFTKPRIKNQKRIVITITSGHQIKTMSQVVAATGRKFSGFALAPDTDDKGVLVLLGEWTNKTGEIWRFHRHGSMSVVKSLKLIEALDAPQLAVVGMKVFV